VGAANEGGGEGEVGVYAEDKSLFWWAVLAPITEVMIAVRARRGSGASDQVRTLENPPGTTVVRRPSAFKGVRQRRTE
jgi:hypothetical protein